MPRVLGGTASTREKPPNPERIRSRKKDCHVTASRRKNQTLLKASNEARFIVAARPSYRNHIGLSHEGSISMRQADTILQTMP
jgi:hypothetical protein